MNVSLVLIPVMRMLIVLIFLVATTVLVKLDTLEMALCARVSSPINH